jgi:hypothetical protein
MDECAILAIISLSNLALQRIDDYLLIEHEVRMGQQVVDR